MLALSFVEVEHTYFMILGKKTEETAISQNKAVYTSQSWGSDDKVLPKRLGRSSNAKTAHNAKKANEDRRTDIQTNRQTARAGCRVACT